MTEPLLYVDPAVDTAVVRALAHPLRLALLSSLRSDGPATATGLAEALGESSGLTSYHLRVLGEHGLVVDDLALGNGRERWWRAAHRATVFTSSASGPDRDPEGVGADYFRTVAAAYSARLVAFAREPASGDGWEQVSDLSDWPLRLPLHRVVELRDRIHALLEAARTSEPEVDAQFVDVLVAVMPRRPSRP